MTVRAVTASVPVGHGLQFYRDLDFHDAAQDERVTGTDIFDPNEWPSRPFSAQPTAELHEPAPANPSALVRAVDPTNLKSRPGLHSRAAH